MKCGNIVREFVNRHPVHLASLIISQKTFANFANSSYDFQNISLANFREFREKVKNLQKEELAKISACKN